MMKCIGQVRKPALEGLAGIRNGRTKIKPHDGNTPDDPAIVYAEKKVIPDRAGNHIPCRVIGEQVAGQLAQQPLAFQDKTVNSRPPERIRPFSVPLF